MTHEELQRAINEARIDLAALRAFDARCLRALALLVAFFVGLMLGMVLR